MANFLIDFVRMQPLISIIIFTFLIALFGTWLNKKLMNQDRLRELKKKQKEIQQRTKLEKDPVKALEIQKESLSLSHEMMQLTMKPMMISMIPFLILLALLRWIYTVAGVGNIMPWNFHVWGLCDMGITKGLCNGAGWFLCYVIFYFIFSPITKKILKAE
jgi:uncharacterized membrane protein (DUF106 family)